MLGSQWISRKGSAERTAEQAWEYLSSAVAAAGDNASWARRRSSRMADKATDRVGSAADEAWQRANAAVDALAGRKSALPWLWLLGTGLAGVALGAVAATAARTALTRRAALASRGSTSDADLVEELPDAGSRNGGGLHAGGSTGTDLPAPTGTPDIEIVDVEAPAASGRTTH